MIDGKEEDTNKYLVTYPEYGNQAAVDLGDIQLVEVPGMESSHDKKVDTSHHRHNRSHSRSRSKSHDSRDRKRRRDSRDRHDSRDRRKRSPSNDRHRNHEEEVPSTKNLLERVMQSSRDASAAVGRNYGHRPASYKGSLSLKLDTYTARKKSPERNDRDRDRHSYRERSHHDRARSRSPDHRSKVSSSTIVSQEQVDKLRKLKEMYGDASAGSK